MGSATYKATTTVRHEFTLRTPAPYVEVEKAIHWARQKFLEHRGREVNYDDDIMIEGDDEDITIYFDQRVVQ